MKVRFYRGPANGKVCEASEPMFSFNVAVLNHKNLNANANFWNANIEFGSPQHRTARYLRTNFHHPDGSIFYEWDKPRRPRKTSRP